MRTTLLSRTAAILFLLATVFSLVGCARRHVGSTVPLHVARQGFATRLTYQGPSPQEYDNAVPPDVKVITFSSQGRALKAWLATPAGGGTHPAVLWAHGGFALGAGDFDYVRPFVQAGYIVLEPAWRGENGNPGGFEMYYGEVDDAVAALGYLATLPGVDRSRLYVGGHSAGGTIALLTAEMSPLVRGVGACGACPDLAAFEEKAGPVFKIEPFDWRNAREAELRSPARFVRDLHCPVTLFYGQQERDYIAQAQDMVNDAHQAGRKVTLQVIPGADHFAALAPAVQEMIQRFR